MWHPDCTDLNTDLSHCSHVRTSTTRSWLFKLLCKVVQGHTDEACHRQDEEAH